MGATDTTTVLKELLERQILLLDGAMGSLIQEYKLTEEEFRGPPQKITPK